MRFSLLKEDTATRARLGELQLGHGTVQTPAFMPVGTQGTVKATSQQELNDIGFRIILGNTYHLYLRPGTDVLLKAGGLHRFMGWEGNLLTDSGGFQVFSLEHIRKIDEDGVTFRSYVDGSYHRFTPELVMQVQSAIGADIVMAFDECAPYPCEKKYAEDAMNRTHRWAARSLEAHDRSQAFFGIVQGSVYQDLREQSARFIASLDTDGIAIGGVSVGEGKQLMMDAVDWAVPFLPREKPRYLMGVGTPEDIFDAVIRGVDMFDCVLPSRLGRNGSLYTSQGRINIKNNKYITDFGPVDANCRCWCCSNYSAAYLRHLYKCDEILASRLATYHNLYFYAKLMENIRQAIKEERLSAYRRAFMSEYHKHRASVHDKDSREEAQNVGKHSFAGGRPAKYESKDTD